MKLQAAYPTPQHEHAAQAIIAFFSRLPETEVVLLVNSCARGKATKDSCLDIVVLALPEVLAHKREELEAAWEVFYRTGEVFRDLEAAGKFAEVHLDIIDGQYTPPGERNWTGGPDWFELAVGNHLAYSVPHWERGDYYRQLKTRWLPYYGEDLRNKRL